ncbi:hypothetical protein [uncultured Prevotella sp.]|uniref:hypothetical protein n=2 Tax=Prevotella TaxID=838 RepID=UPI0027E2A9E5|nr:hypothetical protein [uncultured Prevotella sp.]
MAKYTKSTIPQKIEQLMNAKINSIVSKSSAMTLELFVMYSIVINRNETVKSTPVPKFNPINNNEHHLPNLLLVGNNPKNDFEE